MNYFYLKIGKGNKKADGWLKGQYTNRNPAGAVFWDTPLTKLEGKKGTEQAVAFRDAASDRECANTTILTIFGGNIYFLRPTRTVYENPQIKDDEGNTAIIMLVNPLKAAPLSEVPGILASITCNRRIAMRTFTQITAWGNQVAIAACLGGFTPEMRKVLTDNPSRILECLSSVEFETLVAKLFEEAGCFVPAYRGGTIKDIDLWVYNDGDTSVQLDLIKIAPGRYATLQIKSGELAVEKGQVEDYLIAPRAKGNPCLNAVWLLQQLKTAPKTRAWLKRSLQWLPAEHLRCLD